MKVKEIYPNLFLYTFPNQYELCSTFIRLQEFYESPYKEIRRKYFTLIQFMDLYAKDQKNNKFTYFEDWNGFNVPGNIAENFELQFHHDFNRKEFDLFTSLRELQEGHVIVYNGTNWDECKKIDNQKYYMIGIIDQDKDTIDHEVAHGLYYLNKDYKREMSKLINEMPKMMRQRAEKHLINIGYSNAVLKDELQAYFATNLDKGMVSVWHQRRFKGYRQKIKHIFKTYSKEIISC